MKKIALSLLVMAAPAYAGDVVRTTLNGVSVNADVVTVTNASGSGSGPTAVTAASGSYVAGSIVDLGTGATPSANTVNGRLATIVANQTATGALAQTIQGALAAGTADAGNPVKMGCRATSAAPPGVTAGQIANAWCGLNGQQYVSIADSSGFIAQLVDGSADTLSTGTRGLVVRNFNTVYNGTTWDRQRGDSTGTWTISKGGSNLATGQVSVGTTATLIAAARTARQKITYDVTTAVQCSFGNSGVTLTTGFPLTATAGASQTVDTSAAIYGICASTATIGFMEQY